MRLLNWLFGKLLYYIPNSNLIWKQIPERNLRVGKEQHKHVIRTGEYLSLSIHIAEKKMATHSSILTWKNPMDGGAWWATVHGVAKSRTRLSDFNSTFHFHALEREMATHSSVLAWDR